uniref:hypothetical protein n=1 Tax=Segatella hominis TaxID=2518605 RepID=UPI004026A6AA
TLIHLSLHRSRSFPSAPTPTAKVSNILDTAKLLATFFLKCSIFLKRIRKRHRMPPLPKRYNFHISIP